MNQDNNHNQRFKSHETSCTKIFMEQDMSHPTQSMMAHCNPHDFLPLDHIHPQACLVPLYFEKKGEQITDGSRQERITCVLSSFLLILGHDHNVKSRREIPTRSRALVSQRDGFGQVDASVPPGFEILTTRTGMNQDNNQVN